MTVFTLGYQGIGIGEYIGTLRERSVGVVLDVRENPWSYKKDFSRSNFRDHLAASGILYEHVAAAGNPSENRKTAVSAQESLTRYREYLDANPQCVRELFERIQAAREKGLSVCLTCFEKNWYECHRSVLTDYLKRYMPDLVICHLEAGQTRLEFDQ